jgi:hypothetical protein
VSDVGDDQDDELDEAPGVEEWLEDESQAGAIGEGGEGAPTEA